MHDVQSGTLACVVQAMAYGVVVCAYSLLWGKYAQTIMQYAMACTVHD